MSVLEFDALSRLTFADPHRETALHQFLQVVKKQGPIYDFERAWRDDPNPWDKLKSDPETRHLIEQWTSLIAGGEIIVSTEGSDVRDERLADVAGKLVGHVRLFHEARGQLAQARFLGSAYARIYGEHRVMSLGDGLPRRWWVPTRLVDVSRDRFRIFNLGHGPAWFVLGLDGQWRALRGMEGWFVRHVHGSSETNMGYGEGIIRPLYNWQFLKTSILKLGVQGIDRWALGIVTAAIDSMRDPATGVPNAETQNAWNAVFEVLRQTGMVSHDKEDEVRVHETSGSGHQLVTSFLAALTAGMRVLVLGSNLPTAATEGGSYALAEIQENSTETLVRLHRKSLAETLTTSLMAHTLRMNARPLRELGLAGAEPPKFSSAAEGKEDPQTRAGVIATITAALPDLPIRRADVYEQLSLEQPAPDDDVVTGRNGA